MKKKRNSETYQDIREGKRGEIEVIGKDFQTGEFKISLGWNKKMKANMIEKHDKNKKAMKKIM